MTDLKESTRAAATPALTHATRRLCGKMPGERIGEDVPNEEQIFRDLWEDDTWREVVMESLKADREVRRGAPVLHLAWGWVARKEWAMTGEVF
jgi:hypothetical protein